MSQQFMLGDARLGKPIRRADGALVDRAKRFYQRRRQRDEMFPRGLFGEPAFDMLLELYIANERLSEVSISQVCSSSAAPPTTALRHLGEMENVGLVERKPDPADKRRCFVRLSDQGIELIEKFLSLN